MNGAVRIYSLDRGSAWKSVERIPNATRTSAAASPPPPTSPPPPPPPGLSWIILVSLCNPLLSAPTPFLYLPRLLLPALALALRARARARLINSYLISERETAGQPVLLLRLLFLLFSAVL